MSGLTDMLKRNCPQVCVYWGTPNDDGYGGFTWTSPVEIYCRFEDKEQLIRLDDGTQISSRAVVYVLQDVDLEGVMYLGTLADLSVSEEADPKTVDKAYIIKKFEKSPVLGSTTEFMRKVWLTPLLT
jgi:hypothetical protein